MPKNIIGAPPFPVQTLDKDEALNLEEITAAIGNSDGVSLCVRSANGPLNRGGYFFHLEPVGDRFSIYDFAGKPIGTLEPNDLVRFVNHVSGRLFDREMLHYCQTEVNFRQDQTVGETEA
jgi:hypothetical protein